MSTAAGGGLPRHHHSPAGSHPLTSAAVHASSSSTTVVSPFSLPLPLAGNNAGAADMARHVRSAATTAVRTAGWGAGISVPRLAIGGGASHTPPPFLIPSLAPSLYPPSSARGGHVGDDAPATVGVGRGEGGDGRDGGGSSARVSPPNSARRHDSYSSSISQQQQHYLVSPAMPVEPPSVKQTIRSLLTRAGAAISAVATATNGGGGDGGGGEGTPLSPRMSARGASSAVNSGTVHDREGGSLLPSHSSSSSSSEDATRTSTSTASSLSVIYTQRGVDAPSSSRSSLQRVRRPRSRSRAGGSTGYSEGTPRGFPHTALSAADAVGAELPPLPSSRGDRHTMSQAEAQAVIVTDTDEARVVTWENTVTGARSTVKPRALGDAEPTRCLFTTAADVRSAERRAMRRLARQEMQRQAGIHDDGGDDMCGGEEGVVGAAGSPTPRVNTGRAATTTSRRSCSISGSAIDPANRVVSVDDAMGWGYSDGEEETAGARGRRTPRTPRR